jgi:hypothetical protein
MVTSKALKQFITEVAISVAHNSGKIVSIKTGSKLKPVNDGNNIRALEDEQNQIYGSMEWVDTYSYRGDVYLVSDLWKEAEKYNSKEIKISEIPTLDELLDSHCWSTGKMSVRDIMDHCDRINNADLSYPIIFAPNGDIADGVHRIAKAIREGKKYIKAIQLCKMPEKVRNSRLLKAIKDDKQIQ